MAGVEEWRAVVGYEGIYEVSDQGRVRSLDRVGADGRRWKGKFLKLSQQESGHSHLGLFRDGKQKFLQVHRLVLESFVGPCPESMEACHNNGDPTNNCIENLRWDTKSSNQLDSVKHGTNNLYNRKKTHCPRGHVLKDSNLVVSDQKKGHRECLACSRARNYVYYREERKSHFQEISDNYYTQIVEAVQ